MRKDLINPSSSTSTTANWRQLSRLVQSDALELLPYKLARESQVLPLSVCNKESDDPFLLVASSKQLSLEIKRDLSFASGLPVECELIELDQLEEALFAAYNFEKKGDSSSTRRQFKGVPDFVSALISRAVAEAASDIHILLQADSISVLFRVDGSLQQKTEFVADLKHNPSDISRYLKTQTKLDPTECRMPQDGATIFKLEHRSVAGRVAFVPTFDGERIVIRLFENYFLDESSVGPESAYAKFTKMGMLPAQARELLSFLSLTSGAVLVTGPTGSGKSTLLYAALESLLGQSRSLISIEDPVERKIEGISQCEVNHHRGLEYQSLLKASLRQDPDVILLGEIREKQTANTVLEAGLTGHLVLSTIHAGNCLEIIPRLLHLGVDLSLIFSSTRLLVAGRLVRLLCPDCKRGVVPSERAKRLFRLSNSTQCFHSTGCRTCSDSGYLGRTGVYEMFSINYALKQRILQLKEANCWYKELQPSILEQQFEPLAYRVRELLLEGLIDERSAFEALGSRVLADELS